MTKILVTGAGGSAAYNFIDALRQSKSEHNVIGCDMKRYHLELLDVEKKYIVPGVSDPQYIDKMNMIIDREDIDFIHPQPDIEVAFLAHHSEQLHAKTFLPTAAAIEACHDKMRFNEILKNKGVAVPEARHIKDKDSLKAAIAELSPNKEKVWLRATRGAGSRGSLPVNNMHHADGWIDYWRTFRGLDYEDFMASEFLPGAEFAWQSLWYEGELVSSQARERIEYIFGNLTPSGQTSSPSVAKTINRDDINSVGEAAVLAISDKPHGVFCVDMKEAVNGIPKVTEINPGRFFTTSNFFAHAGLNMPDMYIELGVTGKLAIKPKQKYDSLPDDLYWVRMIDMGFKLVKANKWTSIKI